MKILLAINGSSFSRMATQLLLALQPVPQTEVGVITVVPEHVFLGGITVDQLSGTAADRRRARILREKKAIDLLREPLATLQSSGMKIEGTVGWGQPAEEIICKARQMGADMVIIGARGEADPERFPIGAIAQKVMKYADCSVLLARDEIPTLRRVLLALDGSKYSEAAGRFLIDLPLPHTSEVILVTVLHSYIATWMKMPTMDLEANQNLLARLKEAEKTAAKHILNKTREQFRQAGYGVSCTVLRGEPAEEILMAATTVNPDIIALGAKGLSSIDAFLMGSVVQRVARFAKCSVLVVRQKRHQA